MSWHVWAGCVRCTGTWGDTHRSDRRGDIASSTVAANQHYSCCLSYLYPWYLPLVVILLSLCEESPARPSDSSLTEDFWMWKLFLSWRSSSAPPDYSTLHFIAEWASKLLNEDLLQKYIPLVFWNIFVWNRRFFGSKWVPESSCEGFFLKNCCQFQLVTSCKGASVQKAFVCKSFCV